MKNKANENRKAHWLDVTGELWSRLGLKQYQCSACGYETGIRTDRCFNCEAEMNEEQECENLRSKKICR